MKSIPVGNHGLTLELWETWETDDEPALKLRRGDSEIPLRLSEVRHLIGALADAAAELAEATVMPPIFTD
ncbi:MAG: hypothetical protein JW963_09110 [Anaerolineales bacterium]|nr:hypothetical protein [Anaerolineales bacterium]